MPNNQAGLPDPLPQDKVAHTGSRTLLRQTCVSPTATTCNITLSPSLPRSQQGPGPDNSPPRSSHDAPRRPVPPQQTVGSSPSWMALPTCRKRPLTLHDYWCPDRPPKTRACPHPQCDCPLESSIDGQRRHSYDPIGDRPRMTPQASPRVASHHDKASSRTPNPHLLPAPHSPPTSPPEVQFLGPTGPPVLQAVSPSGDVRLTLRRYATTDSITSTHIHLRMDLRILPRDLYSIPSDGHCGYHSLAVLSHPHFPSPPSDHERQDLRSALLQGLLQQPDPVLQAAATAGQHHPPPRRLPRQHWLRTDWLHLSPNLPPIG